MGRALSALSAAQLGPEELSSSTAQVPVTEWLTSQISLLQVLRAGINTDHRNQYDRTYNLANLAT